MSKETLVIVLGVWVVVLTQLGIPYRPWGAILFALSGVGIAVLGFLLRGEVLGRTHTDEILPRRSDKDKEPEQHNGINSLN